MTRKRTPIKATGIISMDESRKVGEIVDLELRARIVGIKEEVLDVTAYGAEAREFLPGERSVELLVLLGTDRQGDEQ